MSIEQIARQMNLHSNITPDYGVWVSEKLQPCIAPKNKQVIGSGAIFGKHYMVFTNRKNDYLLFDGLCFKIQP